MKQVGMLRKYWGDVDKPVSKDQIFAILENYLYFHDDTKSIFLWKEENIYKSVAFTKISQMATYLKSPASFAAEKLFFANSTGLIPAFSQCIYINRGSSNSQWL